MFNYEQVKQSNISFQIYKLKNKCVCSPDGQAHWVSTASVWRRWVTSPRPPAPPRPPWCGWPSTTPAGPSSATPCSPTGARWVRHGVCACDRWRVCSDESLEVSYFEKSFSDCVFMKMGSVEVICILKVLYVGIMNSFSILTPVVSKWTVACWSSCIQNMSSVGWDNNNHELMLVLVINKPCTNVKAMKTLFCHYLCLDVT